MIYTSKELISIVILTYNGEGELRKCLESVLAQTYRKFEVIIVDNTSADKSPKEAKRFPVSMVIGNLPAAEATVKSSRISKVIFS